jgi:uncharacterized membrane protein
MGALDFIFGVLTLVVAGVVALSIIAVIWDTKELEKENDKLKKDLAKLKERKAKKEYKEKEIKKRNGEN